MSEKLSQEPGRRRVVVLEVEAGKFYAVCRCGQSARAPLCDGTHLRSGSSPLFYKADSAGRVAICLCGGSAQAPLCECAAGAAALA